MRPDSTDTDCRSALFTDFYELTMMAAYDGHQQTGSATFSLFIRKSASLNRGFFVCAGLEDALNYLENLRFTTEDLEYLRSLERFPEPFLHHLANFRFTGDVWAMSEGTICFADEPLLEITAPLPEAQLVETALINIIGFQTMIATKAARCVHAAAGRPLIDFSLRRTQGLETGLCVARSAWLAGFAGTSNVLAGKNYRIPVSGTMAHSLILAFGEEEKAFQAYARTFPDHCIFLIDTWDVAAGAAAAARVGQWMREKGHSLKSVRIDSGDMVEESRLVREILDSAGLPQVEIVVSSGFDEYMIADAVNSGAPIDSFGVGTRFGVSSDAPYLDMVYKMTVYDSRPVRKTSPGKHTLAGEKQVFRNMDSSGAPIGDTLGLRTQNIPDTVSLLAPVMRSGKRTRPAPELSEIRKQFQYRFARLEPRYKALYEPAPYPVRVSPELKNLQNGSTSP